MTPDMQARYAAARECRVSLGLPALTGAPQHIVLAEVVRGEAARKIADAGRELPRCFRERSRAMWWIQMRHFDWSVVE